MELAFLGTGTSQGVPMLAHASPGLDLGNPHNWRTRTSAHVWLGEERIQIDAGPEFRLQALRAGLDRVDRVLITHGHADHIMGLDDLRRFIDLRDGLALPVYGGPEGLERLRAIYAYALHEKSPVPGYPAFTLHAMPERLELAGGWVESAPLPHGRIESLGFVFTERATGQRLAYFTDCKELTPRAYELAAGVDVLVIDALRPEPHPTHLHLVAAREAAERIGARQTFFTHMTFAVCATSYSPTLPPGIRLAHDGLRVDVGTLAMRTAPALQC